jgi:hypothetical protein
MGVANVISEKDTNIQGVLYLEIQTIIRVWGMREA